MRLSAPIYALKREAKLLARRESIPLHEALDRIARGEGFRSWSHLAARHPAPRPATRLLEVLRPGDMVLLAARPGHGKTLLGLEVAARARSVGRAGAFFTLDYTEAEVRAGLASIGVAPQSPASQIVIDTSEEISAPHIVEQVGPMADRALVVIDYLQLLDQRRTTPPLAEQVHILRRQAAENGAIVLILSQVRRDFDRSEKAMPDLSDIRLPNPADLSLFNRTCFLHDGRVEIQEAA